MGFLINAVLKFNKKIAQKCHKSIIWLKGQINDKKMGEKRRKKSKPPILKQTKMGGLGS